MKPFRLALAQIFCRLLPPLVSQRLRSHLYPQEQAFADDYEFTVRAQTGSYLCHRTSDVHAYPFSVHGYYEWRNWAVALAVCKPGDTIIEIGGNIGTETIGFADIVGKDGKVFVFEPLPANIAHLKRNLSLNNFPNVILLPYAVSDRFDKVTFVEPPSKPESGCGHLIGEKEAPKVGTFEVQSVTLDHLKDVLGWARLIVMDVEGAEYAVLQGAREYIRYYQPFIILEASPKLLRRMGHNLAELYDLLTSFGYEVYKIGRLGLAPPEIENKVKDSNWIGLPSAERRSRERITSYILRCGLLPCLPGINPMTRRKWLSGR